MRDLDLLNISKKQSSVACILFISIGLVLLFSACGNSTKESLDVSRLIGSWVYEFPENHTRLQFDFIDEENVKIGEGTFEDTSAPYLLYEGTYSIDEKSIATFTLDTTDAENVINKTASFRMYFEGEHLIMYSTSLDLFDSLGKPLRFENCSVYNL